jgi:hypothetical protein
MPKQRKRSYGNLSEEWRALVEAMESNQEDVPHLQGTRDELHSLLERAWNLLQQQAALNASKQEATEELRAVLDHAQKTAAFLRTGLRYRYGHGNQKLVEFGIQPLRKRRRSRSADESVEPEEAKP